MKTIVFSLLLILMIIYLPTILFILANFSFS